MLATVSEAEECRGKRRHDRTAASPGAVGYGYGADELLPYAKASPRERLTWLKKANYFLLMATPKANRKAWEILRRGES